MPDTPLEFGRSRHRENHVRQPEHSELSDLLLRHSPDEHGAVDGPYRPVVAGARHSDPRQCGGARLGDGGELRAHPARHAVGWRFG